MEYISGNIYIREMLFGKAGEVVKGHKHNFDHTTYCTRGALQVEKLDGSTVVASRTLRAVDKHNWVLIAAGVEHRLTALEDNSMGHCIYAHRNPQDEIVQHYDGWLDAYV